MNLIELAVFITFVVGRLVILIFMSTPFLHTEYSFDIEYTGMYNPKSWHKVGGGLGLDAKQEYSDRVRACRKLSSGI